MERHFPVFAKPESIFTVEHAKKLQLTSTNLGNFVPKQIADADQDGRPDLLIIFPNSQLLYDEHVQSDKRVGDYVVVLHNTITVHDVQRHGI
jgi:hypothetical protein